MATPTSRAEMELTLGKDDHVRCVLDGEFANAIHDEPWAYERVRSPLAPGPEVALNEVL